MKVQVVCPTYGRIPFLGRMLESFMCQTYDDSELVIVNDDPNVELCCDYDDVICINLNKKLLLPQKRNVGIGAGYGDLIMQFDDDDIFLPNRIANHVQRHMENPEKWFYRNEASYIIYGNEFKLDSCSPNAASYLRSAWYAVGGYNNDRNIAEDQEFFYKMPHRLIERDEDRCDYVYNWGGVNYHMSFAKDQDVEKKAHDQLKSLGLVGKKYWIEPDCAMFRNFCMLDNKYRKTKQNSFVTHGELGQFTINV